MKHHPMQRLPYAALALPFLIACGGAQEQPIDAGAGPAAPSAGQSAVKDDLSQQNVVQIAVGSPDHKTLVKAVLHVKYEDVLVNAGPFTVYAPTDAAFAALPEGALENLMKPENKAALQDILEYHVALGVFQPEKMTNGRKLNMANLKDTQFKVDADGTVYINDAKVLGAVPASNGLVVVIDKVLLPPNP